MAQKKEELLSAVKRAHDESDMEDLERLMQRHLTRGDSFNMQEILDFLSSAEHEAVWGALNAFTTALAEALQLEDDDNEGGMVDGADEIIQSLRRIAAFLTLYVESQYRPPSLLATLQLCHDMLIPLSDDISGASAFKSSVARCCEAWWVKEDIGAENLVPQLIPYTLLAALEPAIIDADIKRCWTIRSALLLLDFDDPSIESIRGLLLRCVVHTGFLKVVEGRRFLSFLFTIKNSEYKVANSNDTVQSFLRTISHFSPALGLISQIISVMKPNIASGIKGVASAYGDVIYRAWKDSGERAPEVQTLIEEFVQRLAHETILAADRKYFRGLRILLGVFHENKRAKGVDAMLLRAYGPILWRSLRCANALVRAQATMLFFDAFPLQDNEAGNAESDSILQKQFDLLSSLLKDEDHRVRSAAVSGVFYILGEYWEAIPLATTRQILSYVLGTLGQDTSCVDVRFAMVSGINHLLDQPLAHGVLGALLPLLKNVIHDKAEKVRVAFLQVLDKVKGIKNIHFYDIVGEDNLLAQFADDSSRPAIAVGFTKLLLNSFYPRQENGGGSTEMNIEQKLRCIKFVRMNVDAAVVFYSNLSKFVSVGSATKLCAMVFALLREPLADTSIQTKNEELPAESQHPLLARVKRRRDQELAKRQDLNNADNEIDSAKQLSQRAAEVLDLPTRVGVLRVVLGCLSSISSQLKQDKHEPSREFLGTHMNFDAVFQVFKAIEPNDVNTDVESLPLILQLIVLLKDVRSVDDESCSVTQFNPREFNFDGVVQSFVKAWNNISINEEFDELTRSSRLKQQAVACVDLLCTLGETDALVKLICSSFNILDPAKQANQRISRGSIGPDSALDLLDALINASEHKCATQSARMHLLKEFGASHKSRDALTPIFLNLQGAVGQMNFSVLSPTELLRCIHLNASAAVAKTAIIDFDDNDVLSILDPLNNIIDWMNECVVAGICDAKSGEVCDNNLITRREFFQLVCVVVMSVLSDCLLLDMSQALVMDALESWVATFVEKMKFDQTFTLPVIVPVVGRLCSITKDGDAIFPLLWEFALMHCDATGETSAKKRSLCHMILGSSKLAARLAIDFVARGIKIDKGKEESEILVWDEGNITCKACLELIKENGKACLEACLHLGTSASRGNNRGQALLLGEVFHCKSLSSKPIEQKHIAEVVAGMNKENSGILSSVLLRRQV